VNANVETNDDRNIQTLAEETAKILTQ